MTVRVLRSSVAERNPSVVERARAEGEDNLMWIDRIVKENLVDITSNSSLLLLVGGSDPFSFRLRVAQSHVRDNLTPSAWSHVTFVRELKTRLEQSLLREVSLAPASGFGRDGFAPPTNGIQENRLAAYANADHYPNIALLSAPVKARDISRSLDVLGRQRSTLDVPQLILRWLSYCWGVGVPASPLGEGFGVPSAAVLEAAFAANQFDLTPGLESRSSCPEAIWQAARWWHEYYEKTAERKAAIKGAFSAKHDLVPETIGQPGHVRSKSVRKQEGRKPRSK